METKTDSVSIPPAENLAEDLIEEKKPTSLLIAQFFLFPLIIIAICVGIFLLFGYLTYQQKSANEYLDDIRTGSGSTRWLAAVELSNLISSDAKIRSADFDGRVLQLYVNSREDDPRVRRFLALTLGKMHSRPAVGPLVEGLTDAEKLKTSSDANWQLDLSAQAARAFGYGPTAEDRRDAQVQNQIYTLWAIGMIGDNAAVPGILPQLKNEDEAVRKTAAYVLGTIGDPVAIHDLQVALNDPKEAVQWNAAMALAQLNDASGSDVLLRLIDRSYIAKISGQDMTDEQKSELVVNAVKCLGILKFQAAHDRIAALSQSDPDLGVRNASLEVLKKF